MNTYEEIRAAGKSTHGKVLEAGQSQDFDPRRIAKRMTLPAPGKRLLIDDETTQNAFFDFWLHEYKSNGKSLLEAADPVAAGLLPMEVEILEAHRQSRTSLFTTVEVLPQAHQIRLKDMLAPENPDVLLTDYGLSESSERLGVQPALFIRLVSVRDITMTSGFSFIFPTERVPGLVQGYRQKTKKVAPTELPEFRFVFFFQKYRTIGEWQDYQDVV